MSEDHNRFGPYRVSYAYRHHGDVPGEMGDFYRDAGQAKSVFTIVHNAQIVADVPERFREREAKRRGGHVLPDPHPSYALPARRAPDEPWLTRLATDREGRVLSREEFAKVRRVPEYHRTQSRGRNTDDW